MFYPGIFLYYFIIILRRVSKVEIIVEILLKSQNIQVSTFNCTQVCKVFSFFLSFKTDL